MSQAEEAGEGVQRGPWTRVVLAPGEMGLAERLTDREEPCLIRGVVGPWGSPGRTISRPSGPAGH